MAAAMVLRRAAAAALLLAAAPLLRLGHSAAFVAPRAIASQQAKPTAKPWGLQSQGQRVAKIPQQSGTQQTTLSSSVTPAILVLGLIFGSAALLRVGYTPLVQEVLCFRSKGHELLFAIFTACSILWFLSPSHLAERVARPLRPLALRFASQGQTRLSAVTLAAGDLLRYAATASQAFFAACLVVQALPAQARYFLPFIPRNAAFITGTGATKIMGPWMGRPAALGGWMMELMGILISHKVFLLLTALSAFPTYRFVWRALEPSPIPEGETRGAGGQLLRELLRSCLSGAVLAGGVRAAFAAAGRSLPDAALLPVLAFIALAGIQPVQDLAARAFAAVHLRSIKKKRIRGMLGGKMVNGSLQGFSGLAAQVATKEGVLQLPAAAALRLAKRPAPRELGSVEVPVNGVAKGIEAAEAALSASGSRKKKLLAIPLLLAFGTLLWKVPSAGSFVYGLGVSIYLSAFVLPPPLIVVLALVILIFGGPAPSLSSKGFALGLGLSAVKQLLAGRTQPSLVTCDGLNLEKGEATVAWRTTSTVPAEEVAQQIRDAAAGDQDGESLKKLGKKVRIKAVALSVVAALLIVVMCRWPILVEWIEHHAPTSGHRLLILGMSSGIALRLMNFEVLQQGARRVLPARLAGASGGPGKAAHWFLAVNTRASAVSAAAAFFIPMVGIVQKIAYHLEVKKEVAWVDAWALQISTAFVFLVLSVQAARVLSRSLPTPSSPAPGLALACVRAWIVGAASTAIYGTILLAVGAPGPISPGLLGGTVGSCLAAGVAAGSLALAYLLAQDWLTRLRLGTGQLFWLRAKETSEPFKLQRFEGRHALLTPLKSSEELKVPASQLGGSQRGTVRPVRITIPVGEDTKADVIASHVRSALKQQDGLLHQQSLQPKVCVAEDGRVICVDAFLEGSAPLDKAWQIRSSLLLAAAEAAC